MVKKWRLARSAVGKALRAGERASGWVDGKSGLVPTTDVMRPARRREDLGGGGEGLGEPLLGALRLVADHGCHPQGSDGLDDLLGLVEQRQLARVEHDADKRRLPGRVVESRHVGHDLPDDEGARHALVRREELDGGAEHGAGLLDLLHHLLDATVLGAFDGQHTAVIEMNHHPSLYDGRFAIYGGDVDVLVRVLGQFHRLSSLDVLVRRIVRHVIGLNNSIKSIILSRLIAKIAKKNRIQIVFRYFILTLPKIR